MGDEARQIMNEREIAALKQQQDAHEHRVDDRFTALEKYVDAQDKSVRERAEELNQIWVNSHAVVIKIVSRQSTRFWYAMCGVVAAAIGLAVYFADLLIKKP